MSFSASKRVCWFDEWSWWEVSLHQFWSKCHILGVFIVKKGLTIYNFFTPDFILPLFACFHRRQQFCIPIIIMLERKRHALYISDIGDATGRDKMKATYTWSTRTTLNVSRKYVPYSVLNTFHILLLSCVGLVSSRRGGKQTSACVILWKICEKCRRGARMKKVNVSWCQVKW